LHGEGRVTVRSTVVEAVRALDAALKLHDYRTRRVDTGAYNCRRITNGQGWSLHAYGTAVDLNWQSNPYGPRLITDMPPAMVADIKSVRTRNGKRVWRWGGDYSGNKDAMHFEIVCHPNDLATGIDPNTIPNPAGNAANLSEADEVMLAIIIGIYNEHRAIAGHWLTEYDDGVQFWRRHGAAVGEQQLIADMLGAIWARAVGKK
jgi:hypothetical protein